LGFGIIDDEDVAIREKQPVEELFGGTDPRTDHVSLGPIRAPCTEGTAWLIWRAAGQPGDIMTGITQGFDDRIALAVVGIAAIEDVVAVPGSLFVRQRFGANNDTSVCVVAPD
jgi:hypothetical protein